MQSPQCIKLKCKASDGVVGSGEGMRLAEECRYMIGDMCRVRQMKIHTLDLGVDAVDHLSSEGFVNGHGTAREG